MPEPERSFPQIITTAAFATFCAWLIFKVTIALFGCQQ